MVGRGNDVIDLLLPCPLFQENFPRYCVCLSVTSQFVSNGLRLRVYLSYTVHFSYISLF